MAETRPTAHAESAPQRVPLCRWRTSAETLDLIEALERIEAMLMRLEDRVRVLSAPSEDVRDGGRMRS
jgi:hypothetical protein